MPCLVLEQVTKQYRGVTAVDSLSLSVDSGEIVAMLGPNGAGKTTILNIICGLVKPDSGRVCFFDGGPRRNTPQVCDLGYCPQNPVIWPELTCREQLVYLARMYDFSSLESNRRAASLLELISLEDRADTLAGSLSGGTQKRLNLALSLVSDPSILLMDEPLAGLEPKGKSLVRDLIVDLSRTGKRTVVLATHQMNEAERIADRIAIVNHGKLLEYGAPKAITDRLSAGDIEEAFMELTAE